MDIDVPVGAVNSMAEAFDHPQVRHRELLQEIDHPVEGCIPQLGFPVKFSDTPGPMRISPPLLGQHTSEILQGLGYSDAEIATLGETAAI